MGAVQGRRRRPSRATQQPKIPHVSQSGRSARPQIGEIEIFAPADLAEVEWMLGALADLLPVERLISASTHARRRSRLRDRQKAVADRREQTRRQHAIGRCRVVAVRQAAQIWAGPDEFIPFREHDP